MKLRLPKDVFRALRLPQDHQDELVQEAETVVRETVEANEAFLDSQHTFQNPNWRLVREKEGLRVYCQRRKPKKSSKTQNDQWRHESFLPLSQCSSWANPTYSSRGHSFKNWEVGTERETALSSKSAYTDNTIMEKAKPSGVHLMALHGTMDGTLEDCMFGCFASTDEDWKLRSLYLNDRLDDSRFLATIRGPTQRDPFQFLGIKWFTKENSSVFSSLVQQRDFLIVEASGLTQDSKGETVGYFLMHSVTLLDVPDLSCMGIVRGKMSFCSIFRQSRPGQVTVHSLGFFDTCGGIPSRVSVALAAEGALSCVNVVDYAYIKKLAWLMKSKDEQLGRNDPRSSRCAACEKSLKRFSLSSSRSGGSCRICRHVFCAKCTLVKKMNVHVTDTNTVKQCSFRFCVGCLVTAKKQSVWDMALSGLESVSNSRAQLAASYSGFRSVAQQPQHDWASRSYSNTRTNNHFNRQVDFSRSYSNSRTNNHFNRQEDFSRTNYSSRSNMGNTSHIQSRPTRSLSFTGGRPQAAGFEQSERARTSRGIRLHE